MKAETSNSEPTDADRPNKSDTARGTQNITNDKTDEKPASHQEPSDNDPEAVEPGQDVAVLRRLKQIARRGSRRRREGNRSCNGLDLLQRRGVAVLLTM